MEQTLHTFHRVLSFAGVSIYADDNWNSRRWLLFQWFNCFIGFLTFIFTTTFIVVNYNDISLWIQGACIWTTGLIMFISLGVCLVFRRKFRMFLCEMGFQDRIMEMPLIKYVMKESLTLKHSNSLMIEDGGKLVELRSLVIQSQEQLLKLTRHMLKFYVASVWLCATLYICSPIYFMVVTDNESARLLAFDMWFPWSLKNFNVYIASFVFHAYAGYLCCIAYPGLQLTISLLVGQIVRQVKILRFIMYHLEDLALELTRGMGGKRRCCTSLLIQCVDHYVKIKRYNDVCFHLSQQLGCFIRFGNNLNVICQPFYLALILVATMLVCVCSVKIAISDKLSLDTMKYYVHEFCFILVVYMFCLMGQQVNDECEKLEMAVIEKWYKFDRKHKINVRIFKMAVSQRMPIYIFGSFALSLPTFTWFIRNGMSFFTLVMSVLED